MAYGESTDQELTALIARHATDTPRLLQLVALKVYGTDSPTKGQLVDMSPWRHFLTLPPQSTPQRRNGYTN